MIHIIYYDKTNQGYGIYYIMIAKESSISTNRKYLSCSLDGNTIDLWHEDGGAGRPVEDISYNNNIYYLIYPLGDISTNRKYLSALNYDNNIVLVSTNTWEGRQLWSINPLFTGLYHISVKKSTSDPNRIILASDDANAYIPYNVRLYTLLSSGKTEWQLIPQSMTSEGYGIYHIKVSERGIDSSNRKFLSCTAAGNIVDLSDQDHDTGLQKWILQPVTDTSTPDDVYYYVYPVDGLSTSNKYLTVDARSDNVYLSDIITDYQGNINERQLWSFNNIFDNLNNKIYSISVKSGSYSPDKLFISSNYDGSNVHMWNIDNTGRQLWQFQYLGKTNQEYAFYYIMIYDDAVSTNRKYLSCDSNGNIVDLWHVDDNTGRQQWIVAPVFYANGDIFYYIYPKNGIQTSNKYLSAMHSDNSIKLSSSDDGSGRQLWSLTFIDSFNDKLVKRGNMDYHLWEDADCRENKIFACNLNKYEPFIFVNQEKNVFDAKQYCYDNYGTDLATIYSYSQNKILYNKMNDITNNNNDNIWIGLTEIPMLLSDQIDLDNSYNTYYGPVYVWLNHIDLYSDNELYSMSSDISFYWNKNYPKNDAHNNIKDYPLTAFYNNVKDDVHIIDSFMCHWINGLNPDGLWENNIIQHQCFNSLFKFGCNNDETLIGDIWPEMYLNDISNNYYIPQNNITEHIYSLTPVILINGGGRCLDIHNPDLYNNGAKVQLWDCNSNDNQLFKMDGFQIKNKNGRCLDVKSEDYLSQKNGGVVQLWECNNWNNQKWEVIPNTYQIRSTNGKCLDVDINNINNNGATIRLMECADEDDMKLDPDLWKKQQWGWNIPSTILVTTSSGSDNSVYQETTSSAHMVIPITINDNKVDKVGKIGKIDKIDKIIKSTNNENEINKYFMFIISGIIGAICLFVGILVGVFVERKRNGGYQKIKNHSEMNSDY